MGSDNIPPLSIANLRNLILIYAKSGEILTYGSVGKVFGLACGQLKVLDDLFGAINAEEHKQGHPMLSSVVVNNVTNLPGAGYFYQASTLGKSSANEDEKAFHKRELKALFDYWVKNPKLHEIKRVLSEAKDSISEIQPLNNAGVQLRYQDGPIINAYDTGKIVLGGRWSADNRLLAEHILTGTPRNCTG